VDVDVDGDGDGDVAVGEQGASKATEHSSAEARAMA